MGKLSPAVPAAGNSPQEGIHLHVVGGEMTKSPLPFQHAYIQLDGTTIYYFPTSPPIPQLSKEELLDTVRNALLGKNIKTDGLRPDQKRVLDGVRSKDFSLTLAPEGLDANTRTFVLSA